MILNIATASPPLRSAWVMGILNVTPDSFSDGGLYAAHDAAVERAVQMIDAGADCIDIGGESTRPGADAVGETEELERVIGVIAALRKESSVPISIDTSKPAVMRAAIIAGASLVNDVRALQATGAVECVAELDVPVCLMHMQGEPRTMQSDPTYGDVVTDVLAFLQARAAVCIAAGIRRENIMLDPGFGFGKTLEHNLALLRNLQVFADSGFPVLAGLSRKSMIATIMANAGADAGAPAAQRRLAGSVTLALYAAQKGAHIVRVHDVRETVEALTIQAALQAQAKND